MNKKELFESIMKNVSKEVKKALNEAYVETVEDKVKAAMQIIEEKYSRDDADYSAYLQVINNIVSTMEIFDFAIGANDHTLYFNPDVVKKLSLDELAVAILLVAMHCNEILSGNMPLPLSGNLLEAQYKECIERFVAAYPEAKQFFSNDLTHMDVMKL